MKYLIIFIIVLVSCTKRECVITNPILTYSLDTVIINSNSEILDLTRFLIISSLDFEKKSIFTYNEFDHSLDQIDLEKLEYIKKYPFEKYGPDGTGEYFYEFSTLEDGRFFVKSYGKSGIFDTNGNLTQKVDWRNSIGSNGEKYADFPRKQILIDSEDLLAFGLSYDEENSEVNLDILSIEENMVNRLDLNSKKSYSDLILAIDDTPILIDPQVYLSWQNSTIIVSYEFSNEIVLFDPKANVLRFVGYNPILTPKSVKPPNDIRIDSKEQLQKEFQYYLEQVKYYPPVWDSESKHFLRLSTKTIFSEENKENSILPEAEEIKVFLTIFDAEFNFLTELEIHELSYSFGKYFSKDGKLWIFANLNDEIGFIRVNLNNVIRNSN